MLALPAEDNVEPHLLSETDADGIAWLTFNRPDVRNATSPELADLLMENLGRIEQDRNVRCVVLRGAGRYFMSGGDIRQFAGMSAMTGAERQLQFEQRLLRNGLVFQMIERLPQPVIASVQGGAAGAGLGFMLAADIAIASREASFVLAHARVGASPDAATSYYLPRCIGVRRAKAMAMLAQPVDAATALEWGMLSFVVDEGELQEQTVRIARQLAQSAPASLAGCKVLMNDSQQNSLEEQLALEARVLGRCAASDDFVEGPRAFLEKRAPVFKG